MSANRYIRFVELSSGLIKDSRIPLFSSKFSKRKFNQHQLLILLLLKEYLSEDYRSTIELAEIMDSLREKIHLDEIPHFTTIHKFCQRIRSSTLTGRSSPGSKSLSNRFMTFLTPKNSSSSVTERDRLKPMSSIKDTILRIFTD